MHRIAILSDIHGNLPALEAVLADIRHQQAVRIICLGDLVGKGPSSDRCVDLIREHCDDIVTGNWDDFISKPGDKEAVRWNQELLGEERLAFLRSLPFMAEFTMGGKLVRLFHASPRSAYERIQPWDAYEKRLSLFDCSERCRIQRPAEVVGYGDIHNAYLQYNEGKTLFNVGSVGNPLDIPQASYVILEGELGSETVSPIDIRFMRAAYDIELAVSQAVESGMPMLEPYVNELRTARYSGN